MQETDDIVQPTIAIGSLKAYKQRSKAVDMPKIGSWLTRFVGTLTFCFCIVGTQAHASEAFLVNIGSNSMTCPTNKPDECITTVKGETQQEILLQETTSSKILAGTTTFNEKVTPALELEWKLDVKGFRHGDEVDHANIIFVSQTLIRNGHRAPSRPAGSIAIPVKNRTDSRISFASDIVAKSKSQTTYMVLSIQTGESN